ncbi:hypothetical protein [Microscilla marina]|uniref:Uncharacterized protein n=1 Tax=Microscilla marina ATCC 23134 TaxID=313606 RepID=A1ZRM9_MICM2|nr:hypothetical protein [Microscilla marina]EAY26934.1 hypothetical protein M23134_03585 [Microscilla marina ATCC 23134]
MYDQKTIHVFQKLYETLSSHPDAYVGTLTKVNTVGTLRTGIILSPTFEYLYKNYAWGFHLIVHNIAFVAVERLERYQEGLHLEAGQFVFAHLNDDPIIAHTHHNEIFASIEARKPLAIAPTLRHFFLLCIELINVSLQYPLPDDEDEEKNDELIKDHFLANAASLVSKEYLGHLEHFLYF